MTEDKKPADKTDRHKTTPFTFRFPDTLRKKLRVLAKKNYRSLTAEMIEALAEHVKKHDQALQE